MPLVGRPRQTRKDLPTGLYWSDRYGYYLYRFGRYEGIGKKATREEAIRRWVKKFGAEEIKTVDGTFGELIDTFIREELPLVKSEKTRDEYERQCKKLRERWGDLRYGLSDAEAVARGALRRVFFHRYLRTAERSASGRVMANHDVRLAHRIFEIGIQQGLTEYNPVGGVRYIEERPRNQPVSQENRNAIAERAAVPYRLMLRLTEATGMRLTDVRMLRLPMICDGFIKLEQSKTKGTNRPQLWEITQAITEILNEAAKLPGRNRSMFVFPTRKGTPYSEQGVHYMRRQALAAAGLSGLQHRDIRKAAINEALRLGMNAQEFAGHADARTTEKHYLNEPIKVRPTR